MRTLATPERISSLVANEDGLCLYAPPFRSVADYHTEYRSRGWSFWNQYGAIHEIDPGKALLIGDFGQEATLLSSWTTGQKLNQPSLID